MWHVWGWMVYLQNFVEDEWEWVHFEDRGVDGRDNIRMDRKEIGWAGVDWFGQAQDTGLWPAIVIVLMNLQGP